MDLLLLFRVTFLSLFDRTIDDQAEEDKVAEQT